MTEQRKKMTSRERGDLFHRKFAERVIAMLKEGTAPWQKPWEPARHSPHFNPVTGTVYRGINRIITLMSGYDDSRWMTYQQAQAAGYQVRRGEKGTHIAHYKWTLEKDRLDENGRPVLDADGNYNADTTFVYTVPEKVIDTETYEYMSVNPAEGKVESLKDIEITFAEGSYAFIDWLVEEQQQPYLLNTTTQEQIGVSLESVSLDFVTDLNKIRAVVAEEVTEEGAYTLVIPARLIFEGNDEWGSSVVDYAPEIRINYTIGEDEGDGIDAILAEGGTVDVYTVSGVLVKKDAGAADLKSLKKGIYIINGKKMAVK